MSLIHKRVEDVKVTDLQNLISAQVPEGKFIDYKLQQPGGSDEDKREFLADVSSFANASGGDLIYGMREADGVASEIVCLDVNLDAEKARLEQIIGQGVSPRIPGLNVHSLPLDGPKGVIIVRVPHSFARPHMVTFKNLSRFYSRNSAGKYQLDVFELRTAFLFAESFAERARNFRAERLSAVTAGDTPVQIQGMPVAVLHLVPAAAFDAGSQINFSSFATQADSLKPMSDSGSFSRPRYNFDGLLSQSTSGSLASSYVQLFRSGIIEAVLSDVKDVQEDEPLQPKLIPSGWLEEKFLEVLPIYLRTQRQAGVVPPVFLMFSLLGVSGYMMRVPNNQSRNRYNQSPIDRDNLIMPEVMIEDVEQSSALILRPIFDAIWNAAGWPGSLNYDENDVWRKLR